MRTGGAAAMDGQSITQVAQHAIHRLSCSGASRKGRSELETLLGFLRPGDTLIVTRIDRLAQSLRDL